MAPSNTSLVFKVRRSEPELVRPAQPTPIEVKSLSHSDANISNRFRVSNILFYPAATTADMKDKDPAKVIKAALSKALVAYYPWAGRLKAGPNDWSLLVDCNAEGVGFVEADADVRLEEFGEDSLRPPFPCIHELVYDYKGSNLMDPECPIFSMQVTRLLCGGFMVTFTFVHVMTDGKGSFRFIKAITELARGATTPSLLPVWQRELFDSRDPPRVTCHAVLDKLYSTTKGNAMPPIAVDDHLTYRSFFFGPRELEALRSRIPEPLRGSCTSFELITASVWHSRTVALKLRPEEKARLIFLVDARNRFANPPVPDGYYGNTYVPAVAICTAGDVCDPGSLGYLVEQVKKAKEEVTEEYVRSMIDSEVMGGGRARLPASGIGRTLMVADMSSTRVGLSTLDFGWGKPVCSGNTRTVVISHIFSYIFAFRNEKGEDGRRITLFLDGDVMERCWTALRSLIDGH